MSDNAGIEYCDKYHCIIEDIESDDLPCKCKKEGKICSKCEYLREAIGMNKTWYFFDIDGCVMDSIFPNRYYNNNEEKLDIIAETYDKVQKIKGDFNFYKKGFLYPKFVEFYKEITSKKETFEITFVTGRQYNIFGWLTKWQLEPLLNVDNMHEIVYFPNTSKHSKESYSAFKCNTIMRRIENAIFKGIVKVYDDNNDYFDMLTNSISHLLNVECGCYLIKSDNDWLNILKEMKKNG